MELTTWQGVVIAAASEVAVLINVWHARRLRHEARECLRGQRLWGPGCNHHPRRHGPRPVSRETPKPLTPTSRFSISHDPIVTAIEGQPGHWIQRTCRCTECKTTHDQVALTNRPARPEEWIQR